MKVVIGEKEKNKKYIFRETCFGICEKNGKIALIFDKNQYSLIGGGIEEGESKEETVLREFEEEIGYEVKIIKQLCIIDCFWLAGGKWPMESLVNIFIVDILNKVNNNVENDLKFVELDKAIELLKLPYHKKAIEIYLNNKK